MNRRGFLAGLLATPILLPVVKQFLPPVGGWISSRGWAGDFTTENLRFKTTERFAMGGTDVRAIYGTSGDGIALISRAHPFPSAAFRAAMTPGLQKVWSKIYDEHEEDWEKVFGPQQQDLFADFLDPNSLEEIEIGYERPADALGGLSSLLQEERVAATAAIARITDQGEREGSILLPRIFGFGKGPPR